MRLTCVTPPTEEPVTIAEAIAHLRLDDELSDEALVRVLLAAARAWGESHCGRAFVRQTWRGTLDAFPLGALALPLGPVLSVTVVQYVDEAGTLVTLAANQYVLDAAALPAVLVPVFGAQWPRTRLERNAVRVTFVAGYGDSAAVPAPIKASILLMLGDLYANREAQIVGTITTENQTATLLLGPYLVREAV